MSPRRCKIWNELASYPGRLEFICDISQPRINFRFQGLRFTRAIAYKYKYERARRLGARARKVKQFQQKLRSKYEVQGGRVHGTPGPPWIRPCMAWKLRNSTHNRLNHGRWQFIKYKYDVQALGVQAQHPQHVTHVVVQITTRKTAAFKMLSLILPQEKAHCNCLPSQIGRTPI